jgi:hypothetical protein
VCHRDAHEITAALRCSARDCFAVRLPAFAAFEGLWRWSPAGETLIAKNHPPESKRKSLIYKEIEK